MIELLNHVWALDENYHNRMFAVVADRLRLGHSLDLLIKKKTIADHFPTLYSLLNVEHGHPPVDAEEVTFTSDQQSGLAIIREGNKNIALIPIIGPVSKYGDLCSPGMQDYQNMINRANASPSIDGIVLIMDTPGGTVDGTPELGIVINNSTKPIGVFGDGMVASAGMWLASQADVIVGNKNNYTEFGSIGVLMALPNYQNVIAAGNFPSVKIYRAKQSTEKALVNTIEPITDAAEEKLQSSLDSIATDFIATVKAGRGDVLDTKAEGLFAGRMFTALQAKKIGLIDSVGTLQTAISKVAELARERSKQNVSTKDTKSVNEDMNLLTKVLSLLGITEAQATGLSEEQAIKASEEKIAELQANLVSATDAKAALEARITALETEASAKDASIAALNTEKETLTAKVADQQKALDVKPTGTLTSVIPDADKESKTVTDTASAKNDMSQYRTSADATADEIRQSKENMKFK